MGEEITPEYHPQIGSGMLFNYGQLFPGIYTSKDLFNYPVRPRGIAIIAN